MFVIQVVPLNSCMSFYMFLSFCDRTIVPIVSVVLIVTLHGEGKKKVLVSIHTHISTYTNINTSVFVHKYIIQYIRQNVVRPYFLPLHYNYQY